MMATIKLINTSITSHSHLFGSLRTPGIYSLSQFQVDDSSVRGVCNFLLTTVMSGECVILTTDLSGECVISSVLSHHNKKLKRWTSVTALARTSVTAPCDSSVLFRK